MYRNAVDLIKKLCIKLENKITYYYDARSTIHYNKLYEAIYVEELFPKSYCSFANMLLLFT